MQRPSKIKILNLDYEIEWVDRDWTDQTGAFGCQSIAHQTIRVSISTKPQATADTFMHEVMHAICDGMGLKDEDNEEAYVTRLASGLCTVWRDNPKAWAWWQAQLKPPRKKKREVDSKKSKG